jgi:CheY-like chemotaxis protein
MPLNAVNDFAGLTGSRSERLRDGPSFPRQHTQNRSAHLSRTQRRSVPLEMSENNFMSKPRGPLVGGCAVGISAADEFVLTIGLADKLANGASLSKTTASAWPSASGLWNATAAKSGLNPNRTAAPLFSLQFQPINQNKVMKPIVFLLAEDNPGDVELAREALLNGKVKNTLNVVSDGVFAMEFLRRQGQYASAPRPDLILLDLNMARKDGREVLAEIKADEDLKRIPVVILNTSRAKEDTLKTYNLHANCFIAKPIDLHQLNKVVQAIEEFWLTIVKLPPNN